MKITKHITLPSDAASRTVGIISQKGWGKTYTGMKATELMLDAGNQVVALDPTGVWWGLKAAGTGPGFPVLVMGGDHGDIPLEPTSGELVANFVVESGQSVILDLSAFRSRAAQDRFVEALCERLYRAKSASANRTPLHLMLDEADSFAPQRPMPGQQAMLGAVEQIVLRGRSRGLGMTLISQRPARLNKNVLSQVDLLVIGRITGLHDAKSLGEWVSLYATPEQKQGMNTISSLANGEALFWSPEWLGIFERGKVLAKRTYDSSSTPVPGAKRAAPVLAAVDLDKLTAEIRATAEQAQANDPKALKAEIKRLQGEVAKGGAGEKELLQKYWDGYGRGAYETRQKFQNQLAEVAILLENIRGLSAASPSGSEPFIPEAPAKNPTLVATPGQLGGGFVIPPKSKDKPVPDGNGALSATELRILTALYWLKDEDVNPFKVGFYADYSAKGGAFNAAMTALRRKGLVDGWRITADGVASLPATIEPKPTGEKLRDWIRPKIDNTANNILDVLLNHWGRPVSIEDIGTLTGYSTKGGAFNGACTQLRKLELATGGTREGMQCNPVFLP